MLQAEFTPLFKRYWPCIRGFCVKLLQDEIVGEDMAQFAFIKASERMDKFENEENFKAFVYVAAKNACFNEMQSIKRHNLKPITDWMEDIPDTAFNRTVIEAEVIAFIQEQLDSLSPKVRDVIILSLQGLKSHVVAKMTGATRKTVLNQRRTAVMRLREQIKLKFDI